MKKNSTSLLLSFLSALLLVLSYSCNKEEIKQQPTSTDETYALDKKPDDPGFVENDMVMYWNEKTAIVLGAPMTQPSRTRFFAMIQIAVHDALNNIKPKYERFALNLREKFAHPDAAVASAAYWTIKGLNRRGSFPLDQWYNESLATIPDGESKELGIQLGKNSASAIVANRLNDGFTQVLQTSTNPADGVGAGQYRSPLTIVNGNLVYLQPPIKYVPNWGTVMKPYVIESNQQFRPSGPYAINSAAYTLDFNEIKTKGARVGFIRTDEESLKARFWSENRPSLTWNNLTREAIKSKKLDAWKTARLLALVHTSIAESIGSTLEAAYYYYYWRPETGIRLAGNDGNDNTVSDPSWLPFITEVPNRFPTPPQPGYPSAHATYGGTTAEMLQLFFGSDNTDIELSSATLPGIAMHFTSFSQAARENSLSMICTGWDFRKSALDGQEQGKQIAQYVFNNSFREME